MIRPQNRSRDVARRAVQAEIATAAEALFVEQGFEETTVEQVAAAVGMSSRSVSRYFPSKEDMVVGRMIDTGFEVAAALEARPSDEPPWEAMRRALDECLQVIEHDGDTALARAELLATTPALSAAMHQKRDHWKALLVPLLAARLKGQASTRDLRADAIVSAALSCLDVAATAWVNSGGKKPLGALMDAVVDAVRS
jgi:AcrR family transcriptional regulator